VLDFFDMSNLNRLLPGWVRPHRSAVKYHRLAFGSFCSVASVYSHSHPARLSFHAFLVTARTDLTRRIFPSTPSDRRLIANSSRPYSSAASSLENDWPMWHFYSLQSPGSSHAATLTCGSQPCRGIWRICVAARHRDRDLLVVVS